MIAKLMRPQPHLLAWFAYALLITVCTLGGGLVFALLGASAYLGQVLGGGAFVLAMTLIAARRRRGDSD